MVKGCDTHVIADLIRNPQGGDGTPHTEYLLATTTRHCGLDPQSTGRGWYTPHRAPAGYDAHVIADLIRNPEGQGCAGPVIPAEAGIYKTMQRIVTSLRT